ncbi:unnamed protein product [Somion occarium]|uniref:Uncharacterized protein n=1 Tax=Somion occarium TaxID=3059160 RepID=A0ABP1DE56_9APHY
MLVFKSNLFEQMKVIHRGGFSEQERNSYKEVVFSKTLQSMRAVLEVMDRVKIQVASENLARRSIILNLPPKLQGGVLAGEFADTLRKLSKDPAVKDVVSHSRNFQLDKSATYYLNSLDRIMASGYVPTDRDILQLQVKATSSGITETILNVGEMSYKLLGVASQRFTQRRKWIHCFENVTAVMFVVSLSKYDETVYVNKSVASLTMFESICNERWFTKTSIILLLNDIDKFAEKLPNSPLGDYFPDCTGGNDYDAACAYLLNRFVSLNQNTKRQIYAHYTCATDMQQVKFVLSAIQDILLRLYMDVVGLSPEDSGNLSVDVDLFSTISFTGTQAATQGIYRNIEKIEEGD